MKYFQETEEYPREVAFNPLPWNVLYEYITTDFLNAFINKVKIKKAYLISRYTNESEIIKNVQIADPPRSYNWTTFSGNKQEVFDRLTIPGAVCHSKLNDFGDDVLILSKIEIQDKSHYPDRENLNYYMFFWYDCDCSDSCIGRFFTEDTESQVIQEFDTFVKERNDKLSVDYRATGILREIPLHYFTGWISG
jgi:hypothetical protein